MNAFLSDLRHSVRIFLKNAGFTVTVLVALALGIGATTAIFSIVDTVLLKPMPVVDSDRFVVLMSTSVSETGERKAFSDASPAKFMFWRAQSSVIQDVSAFLPGVMNYTAGDVMEQLRSTRASMQFFRCWGIRMVRGRTFAPEEDVPNGPRIAVISQNLWMRRFGGDLQILGKKIGLDGEAYTVIGIVGDSPGLHEFGPPSDVYVPFQLDPNSSDLGDFFKVVARLKPGVTLKQAKARLEASAGEYRVKFPNSGAFGSKDGFTVSGFREAMVGDTRSLLLILLSAVGLVLLIACTNVANLLLVRATSRRRELAIRAAIGATRGRIILQLLMESLLLSIVGGALGLSLGFVGVRALLAMNTAGLPLVGQNGSAVNLDWRVMAFAVAISFVAGVVFGLFPALLASRADLNSVLKDSSGPSGTGWRQNKARAALVVSETGLAVLLLVGSALLIRSFAALYRVNRGFETKNVVTMQTWLTESKYFTTTASTHLIRRGLEDIRSLPGVAAASATCCLPLLQGFYGQPFEIVSRPSEDGQDAPAAGWSVVSPAFFDVFHIPLKRGRVFNDSDNSEASGVAIISERTAKEYWQDRDPLLDRIVIGRGMMKEFKDEPPRQIVGIVGDLRNEKLDAEPLPMMYVPQAQLANPENAWLARNGPWTWAIRTYVSPRGLVPAIRDRLQRTTRLPVSNILSMDNVMSRSTEKQRFNMLTMTIFGCAALLLAAIGVYGLMAYMVEQRTHEIGIRLAIGAEVGRVRNMVVRQGMCLTLIGVVVGIGLAYGLSRLMKSLLFGVDAQDPLVFVVVPAILTAVALLAVWFPANRASRINPIDALRYE